MADPLGGIRQSSSAITSRAGNIARCRSLVASGAPKYNDVDKCDSLKACRSGTIRSARACLRGLVAPGFVVNHVGFIVDNVQERVAQWKAVGVLVLPCTNNRLDQAFVETTDGVRIEILEDRTQSMPIRNEHVHLSLPETEITKAQPWSAKTFGGKMGVRNNAPVVDLPGVQIRFARADAKQAPTRRRVLDHIGFDVKDHAAFVKKLQAEGIKLDEPVRKSAPGNTITYITDPWGTRIEIVQRVPLGPEVR
jgi:hypothetical protein